jgi:translocator protein
MSFYSRIAWIASTIIMIVVNALSASLPINDVSTKQLSDTLSTLITPIGWTFSIWSVIYLGLILVAVRVFWKQIVVSRQMVRAYIASCLCNAAWIVVWHYGYLTAAMLIIL